MSNRTPFECDIVLIEDGSTVCTASLPFVPRVDQELDVDLGARGTGLFRVVGIRLHVRPRKLTARDDLAGVSIYVERVA